MSPDPTPTDPTGTDPAEDVRTLLRHRADTVQPTPDWADLQARIAADGRSRPSANRTRAWLAAAAAVVVVAAVTGVLVADRDGDGADRLTTAGQPTPGPTGSTAPSTTADDPSDTATTADPPATGSTTPATTASTVATSEPPAVTGDPIVPGSTVVTIEGIGSLRVPTTTAEATRLLGQTVAQDPNSVIDPSNPCSYATVEGVPDVLVMLDGDTATRVDVSGTFRTEGGVGVGSTEPEVQAAYPGRVRVEPHPYLFERGNYLRVTDPDHPGYELLFETADGVVTSYRSGLAEYVAWIEGCA